MPTLSSCPKRDRTTTESAVAANHDQQLAVSRPSVKVNSAADTGPSGALLKVNRVYDFSACLIGRNDTTSSSSSTRYSWRHSR